MARESGVKRRIVEALKKRGYWARRMPQSFLTGAGLPDLLVMLKRPPGRACWLEVKQPGEMPTKLQTATMRDLCAHGAVCFVVRSVEEALDVVSVVDAEAEES